MKASIVSLPILLSFCWALSGWGGEQIKGKGNTSLEPIQISKDGRHFVLASGSEFIPWGFNYDHDYTDRLLEEYWSPEWATVKEDFREMKAFGANTLRIHLQVSSFMKSAREPNSGSLEMLKRLVSLAEETGLYLDVTGLGCYKKEDVPAWYNEVNESERWDVQARFWEAVARTCRGSPAIFCYDLMNEPIVKEDKKNRDWTPGAFGNRYFVQTLTLDMAGRTSQQIARAWVEKMAAAIRKQDTNHLLTVGVIPWALTFPGAKPLFYSKEVGQKLDFVSVHFYPKTREVQKALKALAVYNVGKPIVIEEMFPLNCSVKELDEFIEGSKSIASGWIGFYWGKTVDEYKKKDRTIADSLTLDWLEYFINKTPKITKKSPIMGKVQMLHRLSAAEAAELAARLANEECERLYRQRPFKASQKPAILNAGQYTWGGLDEGGPGGFSALVTFREEGSDPKVEIYLSRDSLRPFLRVR